MADSYTMQTGTNGHDFLFFQGEFTSLNMTITNAYSGQTLIIDDDYNLNSGSYEGMAGIDTLFLTNTGDAFFVTSDTGVQLLSNVERIIAGDGGDLISLDSESVTLGDLFIDGGRAGDIIWSNAGNDILRGFDGDDILHGGPGDDLLLGQNDNDILNGGTGNDTLDGGAGADLLYGDAGDDTLLFFADTVHHSGVYAYNIGSPGIAGTEELVNAGGKNGSFDVFHGGEGYDTIQMTDGDDVLFLHDNYHDMHSAASGQRITGIEEINAGDGDDIVDLTSPEYEVGDIVINGGAGNDYLWASTGNDTIDGGTGADNLWGGVGNDTLMGGAGNDVLIGGPNANSGALQTEILSHDFSNTIEFPDLDHRTRGQNLEAAEHALGVAEGDLSVDFATTVDVTFVGSEAAFENSLGMYNVGSDGTIESVEFVFPNAKDYQAGDTVTMDLPGGENADFGFFMIANGARKNSDFHDFDMDSGEFQFVYDHGGDGERLATINDAENDVSLIYTDGTSESVIVGSNNHIYHTTLRDGATNLNSDGEAHVVSGSVDGANADTLRIGFEDLPNLGDADYDDLVFDITVNDKIIETLTVEDSDLLYGGAGDDVIDGGVGDDILIGGEGADTLYGGHGADQFVFDVLDGAVDTVKDFAADDGDVLNISDILQGFDPMTDLISEFVRMTDSGSDAILEVNADGASGGEFAAVAIIEGGVGSDTLASLIDQGSLIADQAVMV